MRIIHKPGEQIEVDWAGKKLHMQDSITGDLIPVSLFVGVLPNSQYGFAYATINQNQSSWIDAHIKMFDYFGDVTRMIIPDNLKTGIQNHRQDEIIINQVYQEMAEHYDTVILPTLVKLTLNS